MADSTATFSAPFNAGFYGGAGVAGVAADAFPAILAGIPFEIDHEAFGQNFDWTHSSIPMLRPTRDQQTNLGAQTLNPEAFWRRSIESWHTGAGQTHLDRIQEPDVSNPTRFRRSRGIDVFERYQLSLLNDVDAKSFSGTTGTGHLAVAGTLLYVSDGTALAHTGDISPDTPVFTAVTATPEPTQATRDMSSDGFVVATAHGTDGIFRADRGLTTRVQQITGTVSRVFNGKGRWIAAEAGSLYDVSTLMYDPAPVVLPAALFTHENTDFTWNSFAEGPNALYAGGFSGDKSEIYRLSVLDDGTGLAQPVVAGRLPDGEIVQAMQGYLGFVVIGTTRGVRMAIPGSQGELTIGAFIPTALPVECFEGQDRFVWFGGFDAGGLGRLDLETFSDPDALAPAFASDLAAPNTDAVTACVTFQDRRVFTTDSGAAWIVHAEEPGELVAQGEIDSGLFDYGLTDPKLTLFIDVALLIPGDVSVALAVDRGPFGTLGTVTDDATLATGEARGREFETRITLRRDGVDSSLGPVLRNWSTRAEPAVEAMREIVVPLRLAPTITRRDGLVVHTDPVEAMEKIATLRDTKQVTNYTEAGRGFTVVVVDYEIRLHQVYVGADESLGLNGTALTRMKVVV